MPPKLIIIVIPHRAGSIIHPAAEEHAILVGANTVGVAVLAGVTGLAHLSPLFPTAESQQILCICMYCGLLSLPIHILCIAAHCYTVFRTNSTYRFLHRICTAQRYPC